MFVAKVTGSVVSTQKIEAIVGYKLLVIEPYVIDKETRDRLVTTARTLVALDMLGAGEGEFVLVSQGSSARLTPETKNMPIDALIVGLLDQVHIDQRPVYRRNSDSPA